MFFCSECTNSFATIQRLCSHLFITHLFNVYSIFKCEQYGCNRQYNLARSFKKHLKCNHLIDGQYVLNNDIIIQPEEIEEINFENRGLDEDENYVAVIDNVVAINDPPVSVLDFKSLLFNSSLALSCQLYENVTLNISQVQSIIGYFREYMSSGVLNILKTNVFSMLQNTNESENDLNNLNEIFQTLENLFQGLETERLRIKCLEQTSCYIHLVTYNIGVIKKIKNVNGNAILTPVELNSQYIPMK